MAAKPLDNQQPAEGPTLAQYRQNTIYALVATVAYGIFIFLCVITAEHFCQACFKTQTICTQPAAENVATQGA